MTQRAPGHATRMNALFSAQGLYAWLPDALPLAALVLLGLYCLKAVVMVIPFLPLFIAAGALFPTGWAIALTYAGILLDLSVGHWLGRRLGGEAVMDKLARRRAGRRLLSWLRRGGSSACFLARILPVPFDLVSLFFGASGLSYPRHALFSLLGVTPNMLPYVIAGRAVASPLSAAFLVPFGLSAALSLALFLALRRMEKHGLRSGEPDS